MNTASSGFQAVAAARVSWTRRRPAREAAGQGSCVRLLCSFTVRPLTGAQYSRKRNFLPRTAMKLEGNSPQPHALNQLWASLQFSSSSPAAPLSPDSTVWVYDQGIRNQFLSSPSFQKSKNIHKVYFLVTSTCPAPGQSWKIKASVFTLYTCQVSICWGGFTSVTTINFHIL